jgi:hypothetical protein
MGQTRNYTGERGQMLGGGIRKAFATKGDDTTLTRFVKTGEKGHPRKQRRQNQGSPASARSRTSMRGAPNSAKR